MIFDTLRQMRKMLGQLDGWLDAAAAFAAQKSFDPKLYLGFRLAPDQFPFSRQVQSACDTAKLAAARLSGREAPKHPDTEQTIEELHARVQSVIAWLDGFAAKDFDGAADRVVVNPRWEGKIMRGQDYFLEHAVPNFFFHTAHAYAILRHSGVPLGKRDYLGPLSLKTP